jgi:pimeloyl-ACP methyl ester carboxylesterase
MDGIYVERWDGERQGPVVVFLHHGLGSVSQWRDFPRRLCAAVGLPGMAYDREGHGRSRERSMALGMRYLQQEARVLEALLAEERIEGAILVGHSDGGSIALQCRTPVRAIITEAAHVFVEDITRQGIRHVVDNYESLRPRLAKHHGDKTDRLFWDWAATWLSPAFDSWNINDDIVRGREILALQGAEDPYGTTRQLEAIGGRPVLIPNCGHDPHHESPLVTLEQMREAILGWL